jgi:MFS family permease
VTQFLANGTVFAGQMLIPAFLIEACGHSPGDMGWILAPLGLGMMVTYPLMGTLTDRFGIRRVSAGGALLTVIASAALPYLALRGLNLFVLMPALFLRGMGMSAIGLPSMTAAYASVARDTLPMATTSLNIVQRLGGPTLTTLCATYLAWMAGTQAKESPASTPYAWAFLLLLALHVLSFVAAARLPLRLDGDKPARQKPDHDAVRP